MSHAPLSQSLREILDGPTPPDGLNLNLLLERTERRGLFLVMILLCLPFTTPVPMPGASNLVGLVLLIMAIRLALNLPAALPKRLGNKSLSGAASTRVLRGAVKFLLLLEKLVRPRGTGWMGWRVVQAANASLIALMAFVLMMPIPPIIPFSNSLPSYAIIFLSASMMEEDGLLVWVAYAMVVGTLAYLASAAKLIVDFFVKYWDQMVQWLPG